MSKPPEAKAETSAQASAKSQKRRPKAKGEAIALDSHGRERPNFLAAFPDHPELAKLSQAFEAGDYAYVREHAPLLAQRADDDEVRRAALDLGERIKPDPLIKYLLLLSLALLVYLVIHAYTSHTP